MLTQTEAKTAILDEWRVWPKRDSDKFAYAGIRFYQALQQNKPFLFRFKCRGDKWQVVKGWIQNQSSRSL